METLVSQFQIQFQHNSAPEILAYFLKEYQGRIALASSLGAEDQVLTDLVLKADPAARIFTLDTGRLPQETYTVITETMQKYGMHYEIYFPQTEALEEMERNYGPNLFYESVALRKQCCQVRKVEPLQRVLGTIDVWITGLRREQAVTRTGIERIEWDEENQLLKLNPLSDWTTAEVWDYIKAHQVPYNKLHDQGYPSIGCAPCTRGIQPGEDIRAGRWWWEVPEHKECGLHFRGANRNGVKNYN
jgi:phosphoadenosine phosphosulfate reductase